MWGWKIACIVRLAGDAEGTGVQEGLTPEQGRREGVLDEEEEGESGGGAAGASVSRMGCRERP